jgi:hypothetical protein
MVNMFLKNYSLRSLFVSIGILGLILSVLNKLPLAAFPSTKLLVIGCSIATFAGFLLRARAHYCGLSFGFGTLLLHWLRYIIVGIYAIHIDKSHTALGAVFYADEFPVEIFLLPLLYLVWYGPLIIGISTIGLLFARRKASRSKSVSTKDKTEQEPEP